jgi:hypothetical protein
MLNLFSVFVMKKSYKILITTALLLLFTTGCRYLFKSKQTEPTGNIFPKSIIYSGCKLDVNPKTLLNSGFSYIDVESVTHPELIPNSKKFVLWTGIAYEDRNSPWVTEKSPFNNNLTNYKNAWQQRLDYYNKKYDLTSEKVKAGIIMLDIESNKNNKELNELIQTKSSSQLEIEDYKDAMAELYNMPLNLVKMQNNNYNLHSSYGDVPVERIWWEIQDKTWEYWITNPEILNYITHKVDNGQVNETNFSKSLDFYSISAYYFYSNKFRDSQLTGKYLAYMLFQLEVNKRWSSKQIYLFQSFRYQGDKELNTFIDGNMVRNSVIFSFLDGVDGIILYDDFKNESVPAEYLSLFEIYKESISLISKYKSYFNGNAIYFRPDNPRDLFSNNILVVRGLIKNGKLLLAATDPFQDKNTSKTITIEYQGKKIRINLHGNDTYLGEINLRTIK